MIVPMKKVSLIIMGDEREQALKELRKLGVLQIEISEGKGGKLLRFQEQITLLENAVFAVSDRKKKKMPQQDVGTDEAIACAEKIADLFGEKKDCTAQLIAFKNELDRLKDWGDISLQDLSYLEKKGVILSLYEIPTSEYNKIQKDIPIVSIKKKKGIKFCTLIERRENVLSREALEHLSAYRVELPINSTKEIKNKIKSLEQDLSALNEKIASYAVYVQSMKNAIIALHKDVEFETFATGMDEQVLSSTTQNETALAYFYGYIPCEDVDKLKDAARQNAWGLCVIDPTTEDDVPTKLKNNKFVSLIYPLTDFLGTVPGYFEYDISAWFLGFILVFFGIIFGDGGYGLLIVALSAVLILQSVLRKKPIPPAFILIALMGGATIVWGLLTCNWFGLEPFLLPQWLQRLSLPFISNVYADTVWYPFWTKNVGLTTAQNVQIFCFSLALVQLIIAHILGIIKKGRSIKALGDIGSILQLIGMYYVVLSLVVNGAVFPLNLVLGGVPVGILAIVLVGVGFMLTFIFSNYEGFLLQSILASLKNIVSVLLGVVNVFSDIVSYIRLWAVGLAGSAIALTVNTLAGPFLGNLAFITIAIVLLVFGHGLNMILNVLSVIVHGVRLNTLEFSSHLDMSWSGRKFKPFSE